MTTVSAIVKMTFNVSGVSKDDLFELLFRGRLDVHCDAVGLMQLGETFVPICGLSDYTTQRLSVGDLPSDGKGTSGDDRRGDRDPDKPEQSDAGDESEEEPEGGL